MRIERTEEKGHEGGTRGLWIIEELTRAHLRIWRKEIPRAHCPYREEMRAQHPRFKLREGKGGAFERIEEGGSGTEVKR